MSKPITNNVEIPGEHTLSRVPMRAFTFLATLGTQLSIRATMKAHGYTQEDHLEGWRLLLKVTGSGSDLGQSVGAVASAEAMRELDSWDEVGLHTAHAALARRFPAQAAFLFDDLAPTQGRAAVLGVAKFLDRLDVLEKGDGRTATHDEDKKAVDLLASRGFTAEERTRLRALVDAAQSEPEIPQALVTAEARAEAEQKDLEALYAWYAEWTEIAHAVIDRRADLIALGLAKRKAGSDDGTDTGTTAPAVTTTSPSASTTAG